MIHLASFAPLEPSPSSKPPPRKKTLTFLFSYDSLKMVENKKRLKPPKRLKKAGAKMMDDFKSVVPDNFKSVVPDDFKAVPRITPQPPAPRELTAAEALTKYFNDHEWDTSLRRKSSAAVDSARLAMILSIGDI